MLHQSLIFTKEIYLQILHDLNSKPKINTWLQTQKFDMPLLAILARDDLWELMLKLILAGANIQEIRQEETASHADGDSLSLENPKKSALYLAIERGNYLSAGILLLCGADADYIRKTAQKFNQPDIIKKLNLIEKNLGELAEALMIWAILNGYENRALFDRLFTAVKQSSSLGRDAKEEAGSRELTQFVNLSIVHRQKGNARDFLRLGKITPHPEYLTPGFFAAVHAKDLFRVVCNEPENARLTLRQIERFLPRKEFQSYYAAATSEEQKAFHRDDVSVIVAREEISGKARDIYQAARLGDTKKIFLFDPTLDNYFDALLHAFTKKDYIALTTLKAACNSNMIILTIALQNKQRAFVRSWVIICGMDTYACVMFYSKNKELLMTFLESTSSPQGLLQKLVNNSLKKFIPPEQEKELFSHLDLDQELTHFLYRALHDCYRYADFSRLLLGALEVIPHVNVIINSEMQRLGGPTFNFSDKLPARMQHSIRTLDGLPMVLLRKIIAGTKCIDSKHVDSKYADSTAFINDEEQKSLRQVSRQFYTMLYDGKRRTKEEIQQELLVVRQVIEALQSDMRWWNFFSERSKEDKIKLRSMLCYLALVPSMIIAAAYSGPDLASVLKNRNEVCNELQSTSTPYHLFGNMKRNSCDALFVSPNDCISIVGCDDETWAYTQEGQSVKLHISKLPVCEKLCNSLHSLELSGVRYGFGTVPPAVIAFIGLIEGIYTFSKLEGKERFQRVTVARMSQRSQTSTTTMLQTLRSKSISSLSLRSPGVQVLAEAKKTAIKLQQELILATWNEERPAQRVTNGSKCMSVLRYLSSCCSSLFSSCRRKAADSDYHAINSDNPDDRKTPLLSGS